MTEANLECSLCESCCSNHSPSTQHRCQSKGHISFIHPDGQSLQLGYTRMQLLRTSVRCGVEHSCLLTSSASVSSCTSPRISEYASASANKPMFSSIKAAPIARLTCKISSLRIFKSGLCVFRWGGGGGGHANMGVSTYEFE